MYELIDQVRKISTLCGVVPVKARVPRGGRTWPQISNLKLNTAPRVYIKLVTCYTFTPCHYTKI